MWGVDVDYTTGVEINASAVVPGFPKTFVQVLFIFETSYMNKLCLVW